MSRNKKIFIIITCVVVIVAAIVAPTSALYFQEHTLEGMISSRSYDIASSSADNFNVNLLSGETKSFGFFATTSSVGKNVSVTVDNSSLENSDISLWVKDGDTEREITTKDSNGSFVDYNAFSSTDETRLYFVKVHANSDITVKGVTVIIGASSEKPRDPTLPEYAEDVKIPSNEFGKTEIEIGRPIYESSSNGFIVNSITYIIRNDDLGFISAIGKTENGEEVCVTPSFDNNVLVLLFDKVDGVSYESDRAYIPVDVTIYLPSSKPIDKVTLEASDDMEYEGIVANTIQVNTPNGNKDVSIDGFSCKEFILDASSAEIEVENLSGINGGDIESVKITTTDNGKGAVSIETKRAIKNLYIESGKDVEISAKTIYNAVVNITKNKGTAEFELESFSSKLVGKPVENEFGQDEFSEFTFEIVSGSVSLLKKII